MSWPAPTMRHTKALTYSRWERFVYRVLGRWPEGVKQRRLDALARDEREGREAVDRYLRGRR